MALLSRRFRRTRLRLLLNLICTVFVLDAVYLVLSRPPSRRTPLDASGHAQPVLAPRRHGGGGAVPKNTTIFIASVHRNTETILRSTWIRTVLELVRYYGAANVHVSAVESGSQDYTKYALWELRLGLEALGASNDVILGQTVWQQLDELETRPPRDVRVPGWIWNRVDDRWEMRRITYLAKVRNQAIEPLIRLEKEGRRFSHVLWLNDVAFDTQDIVTLLDTRNGDYAAACTMDYKRPPLYYDTFALRDDLGQRTASLYWPWFQSPASRAAALRNDPIPVKSCWNGAVVFDSAPFYSGLQFRSIPDSLADLHLEGSECCLIHADNNLSAEKGVWLNPNVRVAFDEAAYSRVRGSQHRHFPGIMATVYGVWANRLSMWWVGVQTLLERRMVQARLGTWMAEADRGEKSRVEVGEQCLINEMQVMFSNGWKHL